MLKYTYKTIHKKTGILQILKNDFPDVDLSEYISFHSLRNHALLNETPITEQIYIHSKIMIVDDKIAIIGSANINDRSLVGKRDSEICIISQSEDYESIVAGEITKVSKFAFDLRITLWKQYLNLSHINSIIDPVSEVSISYWRTISNLNTKIYLDIFKNLPDNTHTMNDYTLNHVASPNPDKEDYMNNKDCIKGFLVEFPLHFLEKDFEFLSPPIYSKEYVAPRKIFL